MQQNIQTIRPLFLLTDTPLHAGSGDDLGVVDLPIQRERHTKYPKIESSSLKGALRDAFESHYSGRHEAQEIEAIFGPEEAGTRGALTITDARLLAFPVKSVKGVFAWITCPSVLNRLKSDLATANLDFTDIPAANTVPAGSKVVLQIHSPQGNNKKNVVLEEFTIGVTENDACTKLAQWMSENVMDPDLDFWANKLKTDLVVLEDDDFADFVQLSTEVITRTKINNKTGTVEDGALFTEEYLPSESILYSIVATSREFFDDKAEKNKDRNALYKSPVDTMVVVEQTITNKLNNMFQLGGNATLGKGILRAKLI
ncbi:MAG TPA: type III-B CRISPR module RAMP protein Cmr4 [Saprospiraceae bacterium]|nr:type III-B CRISPR module RAMP protein Cmr4 [Saprospiraceae bacterium]